MRRYLVPTAYVLLIGAAVALLLLNVLVWRGNVVDDPPVPSSRTELEPATEPSPQPRPIVRRTPRPRKAPAATPASLAITATRGDCWVEVRARSSVGKVLYAGLLATGRTVRFAREKLWLRLGAASNVDIVVNGRPSTIPPGTVELVLPT
jgi:Domain of unknown function (DUF4115)